MAETIDWDAPPLSADDQRIVEAYQSIGRSLDDLPYTSDFDRLARMLGVDDSLDAKHLLFKQLLRLRKTGRLPRLGWPSLT